MLFHKLNECLPRLFGFNKGAVLLKQAYNMQLYNVAVEDPAMLAQLYKDCQYNEDNVFVYPQNMGITGEAYKNKTTIISNKG